MEDDVLLPPWSLNVKTLTNPVTWQAFPLVLGVPTLLIATWIGFLAGWKDALTLAAGMMAFFTALWAVSCGILDLLGGVHVDYVLTARGVHFATGRAARTTAGAVAVAGALAGSALTAGAGLLALAEQEATLAWDEIRRVRVVERARYVEVRARWLSKPIGIYCTPENFEAVQAIVRERVRSRS